MSRKSVVIILAAGQASRMGRTKQLLQCDGKTLVQRALENALSTNEPVLLVLGAKKDEIIPTIQGYLVNVVINENWANGISSSLLVGVNSALSTEPDLDGVLITLADQPHITASHLKRILAAAANSRIIATAYHGVQGVPVYIPKRYFQQLYQLIGDVGAKALIEKNASQVKSIPFPAGAFDIDTEEDWKDFSEGRSPQ